jgi:hypothetical protein
MRDILLILGAPFILGCAVGWICRALVSKRRRRLERLYYFQPPERSPKDKIRLHNSPQKDQIRRRVAAN